MVPRRLARSTSRVRSPGTAVPGLGWPLIRPSATLSPRERVRGEGGRVAGVEPFRVARVPLLSRFGSAVLANVLVLSSSPLVLGTRKGTQGWLPDVLQLSPRAIRESTANRKPVSSGTRR